MSEMGNRNRFVPWHRRLVCACAGLVMCGGMVTTAHSSTDSTDAMLDRTDPARPGSAAPGEDYDRLFEVIVTRLSERNSARPAPMRAEAGKERLSPDNLPPAGKAERERPEEFKAVGEPGAPD